MHAASRRLAAGGVLLLAAVALSTSTPAAAGAGGARTETQVAPGVRLVAAPRRRVVYDGLGAEVSAPDRSLPPPAVTLTRLLDILHTSAFAQTVSSSAAPTTVSLVTYENVFGQMHPGRPDTPSVPRQRAWLVEYHDAPVSRIGPVATHRRPPPRPSRPPVCTAYVAISASTGSALDGFDICH